VDGRVYLAIGEEVLEMRAVAEAEVLFGSASRGDTDALSDRDILIVDADTDILLSRCVELQAQGWSVAAYTWKKLERLSEQRVLFLQHLKLESRIIHDDGDRFADLIAAFEPKKTYAEEILQNAQLASIVQEYPATTEGVLWVADVLFVCLRNFGVLRLAEFGRFRFAFSSVLSELTALGYLTEPQMATLQRLRPMKASYRSGIGKKGSVEIILGDILRSLPSEVLSVGCSGRSPTELLSSIVPLPAGASAYHRLRNLERAYIAATAIDGRIAERPEFARLRRWIADPRTYSSFAAVNEEDLIQTIATANAIRNRSAPYSTRLLSFTASAST
jgi:hypothetical protein